MTTPWKFAVLAIILLVCLQPSAARAETSDRCAQAEPGRLAEAQRALRAAEKNQLADALLAAEAANEVQARLCGWNDDLRLRRSGPYALIVARLGRSRESAAIASRLVVLSPRSAEARLIRDRLALAWLEAAAASGDPDRLRDAVIGTERLRKAIADPNIVRGVNYFRECLRTGNVRLLCREDEQLVLYGQYSGVRTDGRLVVSGQCPPDDLIQPVDLGTGGALNFVRAPIERLLEACRLEREVGALAADWTDGIDGTRPTEMDLDRTLQVGRELELRLGALASAIDGFDAGPLSRFQPRALRLAVAIVNARILKFRGLPYATPGLRDAVLEVQSTRSPALEQFAGGRDGFMQADTLSLLAMVTAVADPDQDDVRAERLWRLLGLSFGRRASPIRTTFAEARAQLRNDETGVIALTALGGTGIVASFRRTGKVIFNELDPNAQHLASYAAELLGVFGRPPQTNDQIPLGAAKALYSRLICPGERAFGPAQGIALFLDPVAERFPMTLLARPRGGCNAELTGPGVFERVPRSNAADVVWLGSERRLRVVPVTVTANDTDTRVSGYVGIAASAGVGAFASNFEVEERVVGDMRNLSPLPGAEREVRRSAGAYRANEVVLLTGSRAREAPVIDLLTRGVRRRVVHFASHAVDVDLGMGEPALVLAPPLPGERSAGRDQFLIPVEIERLSLSGARVILSACRTARPSAGLGLGLVSGLSGAFIRAGAREVLVTYWDVADASSAAAVTRIVSSLADGTELNDAVTSAQAWMRTSTSQGGRWRDPYFWAAYASVEPLRGTAQNR